MKITRKEPKKKFTFDMLNIGDPFFVPEDRGNSNWLKMKCQNNKFVYLHFGEVFDNLTFTEVIPVDVEVIIKN